MERTYMKRPAAQIRASSHRMSSRGMPSRVRPSVPNSAFPGAMDGGMGRETLRQMMREKMINQFGPLHVDARAEAEADRIGSRYSDAANVDDLKARMGADLGADFSSVRFHTGAEAAAKAPTAEDSYSAGRDIYLGGGFQPVIAAHEMVHTMQTGAVQAAASVASAPAGAVQYWNPFKKMIKAHRKALDNYHNNEKDYKDMGKMARLKWVLLNPIAAMRRNTKSALEGTKQRNNVRIYEDNYARILSSKWKNSDLGDASGMPLPGEEANALENYNPDENAPVEDGRNAVGPDAGRSSAPGEGAPRLAEEAPESDAGRLSAPADLNIPAPAENGNVPAPAENENVPAPADDADMPKELNTDFPLPIPMLAEGINIKRRKENANTLKKEGDNVGVGRDRIYMAANGIGLATGAYGYAGKVLPLPGTGVISSGGATVANAMKTGADIGSAINNGLTQRKLGKRSDLLEKQLKDKNLLGKDRGELNDEQNYLVTRQRAAHQGKRAASVRKSEDINSAVANGIKATGSAASTFINVTGIGTGIPLIGDFLGTIAGWGSSLLSAASRKIGGIFTSRKKKKMKRNTVNEELGIEDKIKALQSGDEEYTSRLGITKEAAGQMSRSRAKHIILKSMGFKSGKYKEAFNQITKNRARALTERANAGGDNEQELAMMREMALSQVDLGGGKMGYSTAGVARKLGYEKFDANPFQKAAEKNRADKAEKEAKKRKKK